MRHAFTNVGQCTACHVTLPALLQGVGQDQVTTAAGISFEKLFLYSYTLYTALPTQGHRRFRYTSIPVPRAQQLTACGCVCWYVCIWRWRLGKSVWGLNLNLGLRVHLLCKAYLSASKTYTKMCLSLQIPAISSDQHHSQLSSVHTRLLTPVPVSNPNPVVIGRLVPPTLLHYTAWPLLSYLQHSILLPTGWELYMHSWLLNILYLHCLLQCLSMLFAVYTYACMQFVT